MGVADHLHLDVPRPLDVPLEEHGAVAERRHRLAPGAVDGGLHLVGPADDAHPRPPPPNAALTSTGIADPPGLGDQVRGLAATTPGSTGTPAAAMSSLAAVLDPMASMASGVGPTKTSPAAAQSRANPAFSDRKP